MQSATSLPLQKPSQAAPRPKRSPRLKKKDSLSHSSPHTLPNTSSNTSSNSKQPEPHVEEDTLFLADDKFTTQKRGRHSSSQTKDHQILIHKHHHHPLLHLPLFKIFPNFHQKILIIHQKKDDLSQSVPFDNSSSNSFSIHLSQNSPRSPGANKDVSPSIEFRTPPHSSRQRNPPFVQQEQPFEDVQELPHLNSEPKSSIPLAQPPPTSKPMYTETNERSNSVTPTNSNDDKHATIPLAQPPPISKPMYTETNERSNNVTPTNSNDDKHATISLASAPPTKLTVKKQTTQQVNLASAPPTKMKVAILSTNLLSSSENSNNSNSSQPTFYTPRVPSKGKTNSGKCCSELNSPRITPRSPRLSKTNPASPTRFPIITQFNTHIPHKFHKKPFDVPGIVEIESEDVLLEMNVENIINDENVIVNDNKDLISKVGFEEFSDASETMICAYGLAEEFVTSCSIGDSILSSC
ncbi:hypothetical protein QTN25_008835 [Entamoeba marina]